MVPAQQGFAAGDAPALEIDLGLVGELQLARGGGAPEPGFQVDAALLQAVDWGIYATWVTGAGTPGYSFGPRTYKCAPGSVMGWHCQGSATLCKL